MRRKTYKWILLLTLSPLVIASCKDENSGSLEASSAKPSIVLPDIDPGISSSNGESGEVSSAPQDSLENILVNSLYQMQYIDQVSVKTTDNTFEGDFDVTYSSLSLTQTSSDTAKDKIRKTVKGNAKVTDGNSESALTGLQGEESKIALSSKNSCQLTLSDVYTKETITGSSQASERKKQPDYSGKTSMDFYVEDSTAYADFSGLSSLLTTYNTNVPAVLKYKISLSSSSSSVSQKKTKEEIKNELEERESSLSQDFTYSKEGDDNYSVSYRFGITDADRLGLSAFVPSVDRQRKLSYSSSALTALSLSGSFSVNYSKKALQNIVAAMPDGDEKTQREQIIALLPFETIVINVQNRARNYAFTYDSVQVTKLTPAEKLQFVQLK